MGLLMNGFVKVPMQFLILLIGVFVFAFYQFNKAPVFFNQSLIDKAQKTIYKDDLKKIEINYGQYADSIPAWQKDYAGVRGAGNTENADEIQSKIIHANVVRDSLRKQYKTILKKALPDADTNDTNYIFLRFVVDYLPAGLVGLLIAIIFLASWGSIAAAINSLASCSMVDIHRRITKKQDSGEDEYKLSQWYTLGWGIFCIVVAMFTYNIGNSLIEAVNVLGSLFYGVILGVFLVAFFFKNIKSSNAVFWGAILAELLVLTVFILTKTNPPVLKMGFLWLNPIGAIGVILFTLLLNGLMKQKENAV